MDIFQKIQELKTNRVAAALVTVIKTSGSVPRDAGTKMLVEQSGKIHGTIGGSSVEMLVIKEAQDSIKSGKAQVVSHDLYDEQGKDTNMVCGGKMEFFIEPLSVAEKLYIFGGGHVALPLALYANQVGFDYMVIDDRAEFASLERFPNAADLIVDDPGKIASNLELTDNDYVVIVTHGHKDDYSALRGLIEKPARYIGMIGSKSKRMEIYTKLREKDGISDELIEKVHSPIGLDIGAKTPEEIAIAIVAELIQIKRKKSH